MDDEIAKKRAALLSKDKKHSFEIIRDYRRRILYKVLSFILMLIGFVTFLAMMSFRETVNTVLGFLIIGLTLVTASVLMILQFRCPICDSYKFFLKVGGGFFNNEENYICPNCRLSNYEVSRYIGMLKSGVEINENNVNRIINESDANRILDYY